MKQIYVRTKNKFLTSRLYQKLAVAFCLVTMSLANPVMAADIDIDSGITEMVKYVSLIVSGVGFIYGIIAVFKWVSAIKQEDSERASQAIVNVFIAALLVAIGPITLAIMSAFGATKTYGLG